MCLLEVLGEDEEGYSLTDLAHRTGLSPSTVHRLLTSLKKRKFVQFDQSDGLWHVGRMVFPSVRPLSASATSWRRPCRSCGGCATRPGNRRNLGVVDEGELVVLTQIESRETMRAITRVGGRAPMVNSGMGEAILATYAPADVSAIVSSQGMR